MAKTRRRAAHRKSRSPRRGGRRNPSKRRVKYDAGHNPKRGRRNPARRSGSYYRAKKHLRSLSKTRRMAVINSHLGMMNPRGRKRGGKGFTKHRKGRQWESQVAGSLPWFANPRRGRSRGRNPGGKAHTSYGQWLMKLNYPANDPVVELGATWARGEAASSRLITQAMISCERWMESRDRRMAQSAKSVMNKLHQYLREQNRAESLGQFQHKAGSLTSHNPRRRSRKSRR